MGRQPVLPHRFSPIAVIGLGLVLLSVILPSVLLAGDPNGQRILQVVVSGNARVDTNRILGQMRLREGSVYSPGAVDEDLRRIYALGEFDNVRLDPVEKADGLVLQVKVVERAVLERLEFSGNRKFSDKDLAEAAGVTAGGVIDRGKIFAGVSGIERKYRDVGFQFVHVALDADLLAQSRVARYTITEGPEVRLNKIEFTGNASIGDSELEKVMESKAYFPILSAGLLDEDQVDRDIANVRNYYVDQGFRDVRVDRELIFTPDKTRVVVRVVVDEGPRYHVRSVALEGVKRFAASLLEQQMSVTPGAAFTADTVKRDVKFLRDTYGEVGYIDTDVEPVVEFTSEPATVDLTFRVTEGHVVRIGEVRVEGNRFTQTKVVLRELAFYPEEPVNTKLIDRAQRRLEGTGLFRPGSTQITPIPTGDPDVVNLVVRVDEAETTNLILGAGVSSSSGLVGNISLIQRNFDLTAWPRSSDEFWHGEAFRGAGQQLQLVLEPGTELQRYRLDFRDPHIADSAYSLSTSLFYFKRARESYDEQRAGINVGVGKELWPNVQGFVNLRLESIDISNIDADAPPDVFDVKGGSLLTSIEAGLLRDTTDSVLFPTEGYRLSGSVEQAGALGGDYTFTKFTVDARKYWTVTRDVLDRRSVLSLHGRVGEILSDAPIFERFYAGGQGSIRGFRYRGAGPHYGDTPLGGDFMALASAEYLFPIYEKTLSGVFFIDTGTVEKDISVSSWRASVGFGVRFTVPFFGPVQFALDFGFPISKGPDDDTEIFSFSIGTSF
jgi:outer membrane protein insertion porin family